MMKKNVIIACLVSLIATSLFSQSRSACIDEVLSYESSYASDSITKTQTSYFNYSLRVTNWEDETALSNIKLYKMGDNMHMFSEQATIYLDEHEMMVVLPEQKTILINDINKELKQAGTNDAFLKMRKDFLDNCEVVACEIKSADRKVLVLKTNQNKNNPQVLIKDMTYEYNPEEKKIISIRVNYEPEYKIKQLIMTYKNFETASNYIFLPIKKYFTDRRGNLKEIYKGFEIVDNRDKKKASKEKS